MKKKLGSVLVVALLAGIMLFVAACGSPSAPSMITRPRDNPNEQVARMEDAGWTVMPSIYDYDGTYVGVIRAMRASHEFFDYGFDFESIAQDTIIWMETAEIYYLANSNEARELQTEMSEMMEYYEDDDDVPEGVSVYWSVTRSGRTVTRWMRIEGPFDVLMYEIF